MAPKKPAPVKIEEIEDPEIPAALLDDLEGVEIPAVYPEKIAPVDTLPEVESDHISRLEARRRPRFYVEDTKVYESISPIKALLFVALHLFKAPAVAYSETGEKIKVWDFETVSYAYFTDDKDRPFMLIKKRREAIKEYFTVLTRGGTATIFRWQNRAENWLRFDPETPGILMIGTYESFPAAVRKIESMSASYKIVLKSCITSQSYQCRKTSSGYSLINSATGELAGHIRTKSF